MTKKLRDYFPMLQTREVILKEINNNEKMWSTFYLSFARFLKWNCFLPEA